MNWFQQHIPNFVDVSKPTPIPFETEEELLSLEALQRYKHEGFSHFAMSGNHLMAVYDDGFKWWVVGSVCDASTLHLPKWEPRYLASVDGKTVEVKRSDVAYTCGDNIFLKDGTSLRNARES